MRNLWKFEMSANNVSEVQNRFRRDDLRIPHGGKTGEMEYSRRYDCIS